MGGNPANMPKGRVRGSPLGPALQSWRLMAALPRAPDAFHPPRVSNLAASSRPHPLPGPPCSTARECDWDDSL